MKNKIFIFLFIFSNSLTVFSQENIINQEQKEARFLIGIGLSKFVNSAFPSDRNAYSVELRYKLLKTKSLRTALNYENDDSDNGYVETGAKIGIDFDLKYNKKWRFYYGLDLLANYSNFKNIDKDNYELGISPFFGIQYNFSKNFSVATEPNIYFVNKKVVDNATFLNDNATSWSESGLGKLGYIQINFHF